LVKEVIMKERIRIAHIMHDSIPFLSGYSIRGKYIVENQKINGLDPFVITSPNQLCKNFYEKINDIEYFRIHPDKIGWITKKISLKIPFFWRYPFRHKYKKHCIAVLNQQKCDIIHAHEVFNVSQVAWQISRIFQKKLVYEMRGLVTDSEVANRNLKRNSFKYKFDKWEKFSVMKKADAVIAISENLKKEVLKKGIKEEKIFVVPNGVDINKFHPIAKNRELIKKYNLDDFLVAGYIGSIRKLEGLALVINAFSEISRLKPNMKLIIVGNGPERNNLIALAARNNITDKVIFTGRIEHEQILQYYSIIDILVFPRIKEKVNEIVTPLKPLEAMAAEKCVLSSDVGGLKELMKNNETGVFFRAGDANDFIEKLLSLAGNDKMRLNLGRTARKWVCESRDWNKVTKIYRKIYEFVLERRKNEMK